MGWSIYITIIGLSLFGLFIYHFQKLIIKLRDDWQSFIICEIFTVLLIVAAWCK